MMSVNIPIFVIMVGLPGSGKSTMAKKIGYKIFSSDEYRQRLFGDVNDQSNNNNLFRILHKDIKDCLLSGESCILDATNINRKSRRQALAAVAGIPCHKVAFVVCPPWSTVVKQNSNRTRVVPMEALERMIRQFEFPQEFEGFDCILAENGYTTAYAEHLSHKLAKMSGFDQHNPHHLYDLAGHCIRVAHKFPSYDVRNEAGYYHDIGKLYTQRFDEKGIAHYYNHDNIGAYIVASYTDFGKIEFGKIVDIRTQLLLFYINYHMRAHNDFCSPKAEKKYRKLFGDELFDNLMVFAEADRLASGTYEGKKHEPN